MGENGDQVLVDEGELAVRSNGMFTVFGLDNDSCCCDGTDPPDPPDDDEHCPTASLYPNSVKVNLGAGWSGGEDFWIPREDYWQGRWLPPDGSLPLDGNDDTQTIYAKIIGAVKSGDDFFGVQKWELRNASWRNHSGDTDLDLTAVPFMSLVSGQTYQLIIRVLISTTGLDDAPAVQVQVLVSNGHNTHTDIYCVIDSFRHFSNYHEVLGLETQHWKEADHPVGTYNFSMTGDLAHRLGFEPQDTGTTRSDPFGEFIPDTYACTVMIPAEGFEPKRPRGGTYERNVLGFCRRPYHAQLGTNGLSSNAELTDSVNPSQFSSWINNVAYDGPEYHGIDPINKYMVNPAHWQVNHTSQLGLSGSSGEYRVGKTVYGGWGGDGSHDQSFDWKAYSSHSTVNIPYDIRSKVNLSFTLRSLNFGWEETGLGTNWRPERIDGKRLDWYDSSSSGIFIHGVGSAKIERSYYFARNPPSQASCKFEDVRSGPAPHDRSNLLSSLNAGSDEFGFDSYAPEGVYNIEIELRWIDRNLLPTVGPWFKAVDDWIAIVTANGIQIEAHEFTRERGTNWQGHWRVDVRGDAINSMNPKIATPTLIFTPWEYGPDPPVATAATNSNDAFNVGIKDFKLSSDAEHIDTKFAGNFPPYAPTFHYVIEDPEDPNEWDLELQIGQTYTFPIMAVQEFENSNRRFAAYLRQWVLGQEIVTPVLNGFSMDRKTGTITWTPEFAQQGIAYIDGVSGFDEFYRLSLSFKIGSGGGEDPPA